MNAPAESHSAVDFDDRHACIKHISKRWIIIDIDAKGLEPMSLKRLQRFVAQMASAPRVEHDVMRG
jgi:hypothetical protein